jgi:hypothetical protein
MEHLALQAIVKNYGNDKVEIIASLPNKDFTDVENDIPSGIVMLHPPNAQIHVDSLPLNTFDYLAVCLINKEGLKDSDFQANKLQEAVPQYVENPATLSVRDPSTSQDGRQWRSELGENENGFAGVFKRVKGRSTKYYVCAQAGAPVACRELRQKLTENPLTFEQLLVDKDYNYCHYLAQRNVQRLAYNVARAFGVPIRHSQDTGTKADYQFSAKPMKALPTYMQPVSTIKKLENGQVGVFNKVTPISDSLDYHFVYEGPYHGISVFQMDKKGQGIGLPAHSGRLETPLKVKEPISQRAQGIICERISPEKHPDVIQQTFRTVDDDVFLQQMAKLGWKTHGMNNMVPVAVKIHDPTFTRVECNTCGGMPKKKEGEKGKKEEKKGTGGEKTGGNS